MTGNVLEGVIFNTFMQILGSLIFIELAVVGILSLLVFLFPTHPVLKALVIGGGFMLAVALEPAGAFAYIGGIGGAFIVWSAAKRLTGQ
jgi:hypothetical protein